MYSLGFMKRAFAARSTAGGNVAGQRARNNSVKFEDFSSLDVMCLPCRLLTVQIRGTPRAKPG
jgi:hypothetical protein